MSRKVVLLDASLEHLVKEQILSDFFFPASAVKCRVWQCMSTFSPILLFFFFFNSQMKRTSSPVLQAKIFFQHPLQSKWTCTRLPDFRLCGRYLHNPRSGICEHCGNQMKSLIDAGHHVGLWQSNGRVVGFDSEQRCKALTEQELTCGVNHPPHATSNSSSCMRTPVPDGIWVQRSMSPSQGQAAPMQQGARSCFGVASGKCKAEIGERWLQDVLCSQGKSAEMRTEGAEQWMGERLRLWPGLS